VISLPKPVDKPFVASCNVLLSHQRIVRAELGKWVAQWQNGWRKIASSGRLTYQKMTETNSYLSATSECQLSPYEGSTMLKSIRSFVWFAILLAVLGVVAPVAHVRADDVNMTDYNTYWQVATDPTPPNPQLDYNTYWAEMQAKQQWQDRTAPNS
jgi:hypothetical protein